MEPLGQAENKTDETKDRLCVPSDEIDEIVDKETNVENDDGEEDLDPHYCLTETQRTELDLNEDTVKAIRDVFTVLDQDKSGSLDVGELETAMRQMGVECTHSEIVELITQIDKDGNGTVEFYEFSRMVAEKLQAGDPETELKEAFAVFDKNGDGKVSSEEIRVVVESLGGKMTNAELENMLREVDENNDGYLDYEEFVHIWMGDEKPESERRQASGTSTTEETGGVLPRETTRPSLH
ncbi:CALM-like protein [Mya arenaria]|uniref:CALM-like protein n=1 Tax=Mya arenaria TaxID=6604 RepID=A0ABY7FFN8_MYAAR|nr:calmodulin-A-like [Mya arenaria]WAR19538.1 CALM-like protein [Mya arenaria]